MKIEIKSPKEFTKNILDQILDLIKDGGQVNQIGLEGRLLSSDLIAITIDNNIVISTATLKNPSPSYRNNVFEKADSKNKKESFIKELGYIVTCPGFEGKGYCKELISKFIPYIDKYHIFATTRKASMKHILTENGFQKLGNTYDQDLELLVLIPTNINQ